MNVVLVEFIHFEGKIISQCIASLTQGSLLLHCVSAGGTVQLIVVILVQSVIWKKDWSRVKSWY